MDSRDGGDPEDCEETVSLLIKSSEAHEAKLVSAEAKLANEANRRWLALLFYETLALLVLQIVLGIVGGSLALIADSGHSAVDVVTYAFNYWIELMKNQGGTASGYASVCGLRVKLWKVDAIGSTLSLAALLATIGFVTVKALRLLHSSDQDIKETQAQYQLRGSVLFYFAAASTLGNVAVLVMYQRFHPQHGSLAKKARKEQDMEQANAAGELAGTSGTSEGTGMRLRRGKTIFRVEMRGCRDPDCNSANCPDAQVNGQAPDQGDIPMCGVCDNDDCDPGNHHHDYEAKGKHLGRRGIAFRAEMKHGRGLDCDPANCPKAQPNIQDPDQGDTSMCGFCDDDDPDEGDTPMCGVCDDDDSDQGDIPMCGVCDDDDCDKPNDQEYDDETNHRVESCTSKGQSDSDGMSLLHTLIHPGCQGCSCHGDSGGRSRHSDCVESRMAANNLNVASAMLHLMSDIFRGIAIFVVAILIKMGVVRNSIKADGICALLVAGFIIMGAFALFHKVFSVCLADRSDRD